MPCIKYMEVCKQGWPRSRHHFDKTTALLVSNNLIFIGTCLLTKVLSPFQGANQPPPQPMKPSELYYSKVTPALKEKVTTYFFDNRYM